VNIYSEFIPQVVFMMNIYFRYFRRYVNIYCEFIPQLVFLLSLFGYLCFLVFFKWFMYGDGPDFDEVHGSACAPSVLITFINMVLNKEDPVSFGFGQLFLVLSLFAVNDQVRCCQFCFLLSSFDSSLIHSA
jgi:vacuolar-type H+-ATPase subunit I/STV1